MNPVNLGAAIASSNAAYAKCVVISQQLSETYGIGISQALDIVRAEDRAVYDLGMARYNPPHTAREHEGFQAEGWECYA